VTVNKRPLTFYLIYIFSDDFFIDISDDGLRKYRNLCHTCKSQLKQTYVVFDGMNVVEETNMYLVLMKNKLKSN